MEYETINKETPEMKQLISGIKGLTNRVRSIAQTHRPLFEGEIYLTGREVCERLFQMCIRDRRRHAPLALGVHRSRLVNEARPHGTRLGMGLEEGQACLLYTSRCV